MNGGLWGMVLFVISTLAVGTGASKQDEEAKHEPNYYDIYQAIDTLHELTPDKRTFYDLLGVAPDADSETFGRAFRRTSLLFHPDKLRPQGTWNERAERMSKLVQSIGSLLRTPQGRRDYDWVLNEAPAWHRQSVYVMRRLTPTSKLSIGQVIVIVLVFSVVLQLIGQWIGYGKAWYMILSSRWALRSMGEKEVKRMRKRIVGVDPAFIAMNNTAYHTIMLADSTPPSIPSPLSLWPFQLILFPFRQVLKLKSKKD